MVSVLNTVDTGHEDMIHDAEMDYYGLKLATCSSDNSVKIFDLKNGTQSLVAVLKGHIGPVWQVAWAHPKFGNLLASCSYDRYTATSLRPPMLNTGSLQKSVRVLTTFLIDNCETVLTLIRDNVVVTSIQVTRHIVPVPL